jgi:hypothetical protein
MNTRWLAGIALMLLFLGRAGAEQNGIRPWPFYTDRPGEISVVLEMSPDSARPQAQELQLLEDDKTTAEAFRIETFENSDRAMTLLLCVDVSGTMGAGRGSTKKPLEDIKDALLNFIARLRPSDRVALITFGTRAQKIAGFADNRGRLKQAIRGLEAETQGRTRLYDTLYDALDLFLNNDTLPKRQHIIVISDGKDEGSIASKDTVVEKARTQAVSIDAIGYGRIAEQYGESLRGLAPQTHGMFVDARPAALSLEDALGRIFNHLTQTSLVAYFKQPHGRLELLTHEAGVQWTPAGEGHGTSYLVKAEIPRSAPPPTLPVKRPPPPPPPPEDPWWKPYLYPALLVLGGLLALLVVLMALTKRGKEEDEQQEDERPKPVQRREPASPKPETYPELGTPVTDRFRDRLREQPPETPPSRQRRTQVGGYFPEPGPGRPTAVLSGVEGPAKGHALALEGETASIGADRTNDLCIDDEFMSARHAQLRYEHGSLYLSDLGSSNGSFVNDTRVGERAVSLKLGDRIRLGRSVFTLAPAED